MGSSIHFGHSYLKKRQYYWLKMTCTHVHSHQIDTIPLCYTAHQLGATSQLDICLYKPHTIMELLHHSLAHYKL